MFWLKIEQCSNRCRNLVVPDGSCIAYRIAYRVNHVPETGARKKWSRFMAPFSGALHVYKRILPIAADLQRLSDMPSTRRLRSSLTHQLDVRQSQCATVGDRAFATAGARLWNSLPTDIVACDTLSQFRRERKTFLFRQSYPDIFFSFSSWSLLFLLRPREKISMLCNVMFTRKLAAVCGLYRTIW